MSNPRFFVGCLDEATYTMSLTENTSYPLANLSSYVPTDLWKSSAATNAQTLNIDFGSVKSRDFVIIDQHNFNGMTSVKLQVGTTDDGAFAVPIDVDTLQGEGTGVVKLEFAAVSKRYWRIIFTDTNSLTPQLGQIFINTKFDAGFTQVFPHKSKNEDTPSTVRRALSGIARSARTYGVITRFEIKFDTMNETFATNWLRFHQKVAGQIPFYYYDVNDACWYVFFSEKVDLESVRYQLNNTGTLRMETQGVNQNTLS